MSHFDDLDRFLAQQQALVEEASRAAVQNVEKARAGHEPLTASSPNVLKHRAIIRGTLKR